MSLQGSVSRRRQPSGQLSAQEGGSAHRRAAQCRGRQLSVHNGHSASRRTADHTGGSSSHMRAAWRAGEGSASHGRAAWRARQGSSSHGPAAHRIGGQLSLQNNSSVQRRAVKCVGRRPSVQDRSSACRIAARCTARQVCSALRTAAQCTGRQRRLPDSSGQMGCRDSSVESCIGSIGSQEAGRRLQTVGVYKPRLRDSKAHVNLRTSSCGMLNITDCLGLPRRCWRNQTQVCAYRGGRTIVQFSFAQQYS